MSSARTGSARTSRRGDGPARLIDERRILTREECDEIFERICALARGGGDTSVQISSWWQGELRWARNRANLASDRRDIRINVVRNIRNGDRGTATTNQLDDTSLEAATRSAERISGLKSDLGYGVHFLPPMPAYERPELAIWSDATYGLTTDERAKIASAMMAPAEARGMLSAGYVELRAASRAHLDTAAPELRTSKHAFWEEPYLSWTQAHCSTTVRDPKGTASGWAGLSTFDWGTLDAAALGARALEKCIASQNPVSLEPGRYTVILEPQAVADLMEPLANTFSRRESPEQGFPSPWRLGQDDALGIWRSKLGMKVVDERISISHDPADSALGIVPYQVEWPGAVTWVENGVLAKLGHYLPTDISSLEGRHLLRGADGYRMSGGSTSIEEMIRTTRRGLLVTRFTNVRKLDDVSVLSTGLTRDGLWLIENGKITKAVKHFRFTESPLFMLNSIEQLGVPERVFRPTRREGGMLTPAIVPPLKVRDFSFTSTIDAI